MITVVATKSCIKMQRIREWKITANNGAGNEEGDNEDDNDGDNNIPDVDNIDNKNRSTMAIAIMTVSRTRRRMWWWWW